MATEGVMHATGVLVAGCLPDGKPGIAISYEVAGEFLPPFEASGKQGEDLVALVADDVAFANLYFDALRVEATGSAEPPRSWDALIESRSAPRVCTIQFAVAGMNAHINFDLSRALVAACAEVGRAPGSDTQRADFEKVNEILGAEMRGIRQLFQDRLEDWIDDHVLGQVDDVIGKWSIETARDTAWNNAELLWSLRDEDMATRLFLTGLDRLVGLAGRGLLVRL